LLRDLALSVLADSDARWGKKVVGAVTLFQSRIALPCVDSMNEFCDEVRRLGRLAICRPHPVCVLETGFERATYFFTLNSFNPRGHEDESCPVCGSGPDTPQHLALQCSDPLVLDIVRKGSASAGCEIDQFRSVLASLTQQRDYSSRFWGAISQSCNLLWSLRLRRRRDD